MISLLSGFIFIISAIAFSVFLIWGLVKTHRVDWKTWLWLLVAIIAIVVSIATAKTPAPLTMPLSQS